MNQNNSIDDIMAKPLWQLTCEEFCILIRYANSESQEYSSQRNSKHAKYAYGVHDLSVQIGCSNSTIFLLRKLGVLEDAIVSRIGRKIVFDLEKARTLAENYQKERRNK